MSAIPQEFHLRFVQSLTEPREAAKLRLMNNGDLEAVAIRQAVFEELSTSFSDQSNSAIQRRKAKLDSLPAQATATATKIKTLLAKLLREECEEVLLREKTELDKKIIQVREQRAASRRRLKQQEQALKAQKEQDEIAYKLRLQGIDITQVKPQAQHLLPAPGRVEQIDDYSSSEDESDADALNLYAMTDDMKRMRM
jgi:hypothetical protein